MDPFATGCGLNHLLWQSIPSLLLHWAHVQLYCVVTLESSWMLRHWSCLSRTHPQFTPLTCVGFTLRMNAHSVLASVPQTWQFPKAHCLCLILHSRVHAGHPPANSNKMFTYPLCLADSFPTLCGKVRQLQHNFQWDFLKRFYKQIKTNNHVSQLFSPLVDISV